MSHVIMGAGALGSLIGFYLTSGNEEVVLVDSNTDRIRQISEHGVQIVGFRGSGRQMIRATQVENLGDLGPISQVTLCVKSDDVETALEVILPYCQPETLFVSFLGGLASLDLSERLNSKEIIAMVTNCESRLRSDGLVETGFHNFTWAGHLDGQFSKRLSEEQVRYSWVAPTISVSVVPGIIWSKAIYSLEAVLSALVEGLPKDLFMKPATRTVAAALIRENLALAEAYDVDCPAFDFFDPNMYRAKSQGEGLAMDTWIKHAWMRHESFRTGLEDELSCKTGLSWSMSPKNPASETPLLIQDLMSKAQAVGMELPLTKKLGDIYDQVVNGDLEYASFEAIEQLNLARRQFGIDIPGAN